MTADAHSSRSEEHSPLRERKKRQTSLRIHQEALRMVLERGSAAEITVREICKAAEVSPRTFFNYYSSKPSAVLGIPSLTITTEGSERFLNGDGDLVEDLCVLVADIIESNGVGLDDHRQVKHLLREDPELGFEMFTLLRSFRAELRALVSRRSDPRTAAMAVALVFTAIPFCYFPPANSESEAPLRDRLRASLQELRNL